MTPTLESIAHVETLHGPDADPDAPPDLLVEAPHGATERVHYDALAARMVSDLPADLHAFFHVNTDVGSWEVGRAVAEAVIAADPRRKALVVRCLVPRTLIDVNRVVDAQAGNLREGGLTAAIPPYITHDTDRAVLLDLHRRYTALVDAAYARVCGHGGVALISHTYGPVTLGIERVDAHIVANLRAAHAPEVYASWPVRPEVDLITRDEDGRLLAPPVEDALVARFAEAGYTAVIGESYFLHPVTMGRVWSARHPGQVLCLELRRDLLVEDWLWDQPMAVVPARVAALAAPLATTLDTLLR